MLVFEEKGKQEYPGETSRSRVENQQQTQPSYDAGTRNTLPGGGVFYHCAIPAPPKTGKLQRAKKEGVG